MKTKENIWTKEEEALLILGYTTAELAEHPLMVARGRSRKNIRKKMWRDCIKLAKPPKAIKPKKPAKAQVTAATPEPKELEAPKVRIRVKPSPQPKPLYQFIKTSEATPARVKEWGRLTQEEKRAMQTV